MNQHDSIFADDVELIKRAEVLEEDYTPDEIVCRDDILDEYIDVFKPIYKGRPPQNAFLYGDTGVGKTAATKYLREQLEQDIERKNELAPEEEHISFTTIWVNCENLTTGQEETSSYQVAVNIVNQLREPGNKITGTGHAPQDVYGMLYEELDAVGGTVLVVLDEVDRIGDDDTLLYDLPRARDNGYLSNVRVGVIGISNDYTFRNNLSPKVKDSLCETDIKFPAYDATELKQILVSRASKALHGDVYDEGILGLCASLAYKEASGSARRSIKLLKRAAEIAEREGDETVRENHVYDANQDLEYGNIVESIADQDEQKLYVLKSLAILDQAGMTPARTKTIHETYSMVSELHDEHPLTQRGMFNHVSKLVMFGFVHGYDKNRGKKGGQWNEYEFSDEVAVTAVRDAFLDRNLPWHKDGIEAIKRTISPRK